jgi:hypothetical protein
MAPSAMSFRMKCQYEEEAGFNIRANASIKKHALVVAFDPEYTVNMPVRMHQTRKGFHVANIRRVLGIKLLIMNPGSR